MKHYLVEFECIEHNLDRELPPFRFSMSEVFQLHSPMDVNELKQRLHFRFYQTPFKQGRFHTHEGSINAEKYKKAQAEVEDMRSLGKISEDEFKCYQSMDCEFSHIKNVTLIEETPNNQ